MGKINVYNQPEWVGKRFNNLTVIEPVFRKRADGFGSWYWRCKCDCGNETVSLPRDLISGRTKSCGCYKALVTGNRRRVHGETRTPLHMVWVSMRMRCRDKRVKNYGGRGICVCDEWNDYVVFRDWALSHGYSEGLTIERIDVNGNYCPENCKWIPLVDQAKNKRNTLRVFVDGEYRRLLEVCNERGLNYDTVHGRIYASGWTVEDAIGVPTGHGDNRCSSNKETAKEHFYDYNGKRMNLSEIAKAEGIVYQTLYAWVVRRGVPLNEAIDHCKSVKREGKSLRQRCLEHGMNYTVVQSRITALGWSEERALNTPSLGKGANQTSYTD